MTVDMIEPTDAERGYHEGWQAYHHGRMLNSNPYDPEAEMELYEGFTDGWSNAQLGDSE